MKTSCIQHPANKSLSELRKIDSFGFIYLIHAVGSGRWKIGFTKGTPGKRLKQIACSAPFPMELVAHAKSLDARRDEAILHERFKRKRVYGEWYELDNADIESLKQAMSNDRGNVLGGAA